jgi:hypothetical protein
VAAIVVCALACGGLIALGRSASLPLLIAIACAGVLVLAVIVRRPELSVYLLLFAALVFDQWPVVGIDPFTQELHVFQTISGFTPIPLPLMPVDLLLVFGLALLVLPALIGQPSELDSGPLAIPAFGFFALTALTLVHGYAAGPTGTVFNVNAAWAEARSFVQMVLAYFLTVSLIRTRARLTTYIWVLIIALGLKGIQGINSFFVEKRRGLHLEALIGHEDVVFFASFLLLLAGLLLFGGPRRQVRAMLWFLGPIAFTDLVAGRRLAFFVLGLGFLLLGYCLYRARRRLFMRIAPIVIVLLAVYTAAFWSHNNNPLGQPVRAFKSQFAEKSERDRASDQWRVLENYNLGLNIRNAPITGLGFGRPYHFYIEIPSLDSTGFIYWIYMNHNAIFWVWMKMGFPGFVAFWFLFGAAISHGLITFRRTNDGFIRSIALAGVSLMMMQIFFSYGDLGLTYSRSMIYVGLMMGVLARLPEIAREEPTPPVLLTVPERRHYFAHLSPQAGQRD